MDDSGRRGGCGFFDLVSTSDLGFGEAIVQVASFPAGVSCASVFGPDVNPHMIVDVDNEVTESNEGNNFGLLLLNGPAGLP